MCESASVFPLPPERPTKSGRACRLLPGNPPQVWMRTWTRLQCVFSLLSSFRFFYCDWISEAIALSYPTTHTEQPQHPSVISAYRMHTHPFFLQNVRLHVSRRGWAHEKRLNAPFSQRPDPRKHARHPIVIRPAICDCNPQLHDITVSSPPGPRAVLITQHVWFIAVSCHTLSLTQHSRSLSLPSQDGQILLSAWGYLVLIRA